MPNPWDVGTARILAGLGYEALATTSAGLAYSLGRSDGEAAVTRAEALEHSAVIAAATPTSRSTATSRTASATIRRASPRRSAAPPQPGLVGCSIEDSTRLPASRSTRSRRPSSASPRPQRPPRRCPSRSRSRRAPRTSCTAAPTWTTRSRACRPSKGRAPMCSTRRSARDRGRSHALLVRLAARQLPGAARRTERRGALRRPA